MQPLATIVIFTYAAILIAGGVIGWRVSGSRVSLTAGLASAAVLAMAHRVSLFSPGAGYLLATGAALVLAVLFTRRLKRTGKFMPSGLMLIFSAAAACMLTAIAVLSW